MNESSEPRWEHLPHDPEQFFGLSGNFDLRALKRSYNRLIRRFKPERSPNEFQRIRAAYESLSDALRYNLPAQQPTRVEWPTSAEPGEATNRQEPAAPPETPILAKAVDRTTGPPLYERVAASKPADLYFELKSRSAKTPQDYVHLALLSDCLETEPNEANGESFADWIFAGVAEHPDDWGLIQLLREYLCACEEQPVAQLAEMLLRAVGVIPADRFQYTTERAWDRLLREAPFEDFRDCLERCGRKLGRSMDHSQLVFYLHVLKLALWKADDEFLDELRGAVEDHFHTLTPWAQEEFELVVSLLEYRAKREEFVRLGPACRRIDQAIQDWCVLEETQADLSVLDCQYYLSLRGRRLLDEFPEFSSEFSYVLLPWDRIVTDVLDRLGDPEPTEDLVLLNHARDFMVRVMRRNKRTIRYYFRVSLILAALATLLTTLVISGSLSIRMCLKLFDGSTQGGWLDGLFAVLALVVGLAVSIGIFLYRRRMPHLQYASVRPELIKLVRVATLRVAELARYIAAMEGQKYGTDDDQIRESSVIASQMRLDPGIELFSLAQVCVGAAAPEPIVEATIIEPVVKERRSPRKPMPRRLR